MANVLRYLSALTILGIEAFGWELKGSYTLAHVP